jgi:hypothetical protein
MKRSYRGSKRAELVECFCCKIPCVPEYHHMKPRRIGGTDDPDNLVPLCVACHDMVDRFHDNTLATSWLWSNRPEDSRWAGIMLLKIAQLAFENSEYIVRFGILKPEQP